MDLAKLTRELESFKDEIKSSVSVIKRPRTRTDAVFAKADYKRFQDARRQSLTLQRQLAEWNGGAAKEQLFKLFDSFGPKDPLTLKGRRRLSSMHRGWRG